ncbi:putative cell-wall lytic enzyme [Rhodobacteraceae bacterium HTCC2083]|jgi:lysozyme|nr:putative cell-wall lytic enzyme [Rhodobacteraceae bacterium HTCC2083]
MKIFHRSLAASAFGIGLLSGSSLALADGNNHLTGIDLSHHNDIADWSEIKSSELSFIILKATDGMDYLDPTFTDRYNTLAATGMIRGAYHFYETNDDPNVQADWFIKNVPLQEGDLPPIVDIERVKAPVSNSLHRDFKTFLERLEDHYGFKPIIYTGTNFWDHVMKEHLPNYRLWIAQYGADSPTIPDGWHTWTIWQHTETQIVSGINGNTDGSRFNGDIDDLRSVLLTED